MLIFELSEITDDTKEIRFYLYSKKKKESTSLMQEFQVMTKNKIWSVKKPFFLIIAKKSINVEIISDLGSGMNYKKKGLNKLISLIISSKIDTIYLTHKDRLLRFGSDLIINLAEKYGTKFVILNQKTQSFEEELSKDVIEIITVFSAKLYGKRSHKNKTKSA